MKNHDIIELDCYVRHETNSAFLVETGVGMKAWVPKSRVEVERRSGSLGECDNMQIPEWMAIEKGLV